MSATVFDIETGGYDYADQLMQFEPTFKPDARIKDPEKLRADLESKQLDWLESAALDAGRSKVLMIGIYKDQKTTLLEGDEAVMIRKFWDLYQKSAGIFIGHNCRSYDVPFLVRRSYILKVPVPPGIFDGRYISRRVVCTMETWAAGEWGAKISLDNLARALSVGKKSGSGKDFASLYAKDPEAARQYCITDILLTSKCADRLYLK